MSLGTLPTWGCLRGGELFELPTPVLLMDANESSLSFMLPTPTVMDMGANYTPEEWEAWKARQQETHRNGNGHGASLTQEAISLPQTGANTRPLFPDGSAPSDDPHRHPPSSAAMDDPDCLPYSSNG